MASPRILLERIYDDARQDGYRVLVDRLWPRGVSKDRAGLDGWCKDLAPSPKLRTWFGHRPERWTEFRQRDNAELKGQAAAAEALLQCAGRRTLVLVYGAKDREHTHALVLQDYLRHAAARLAHHDDEPVEVASPVCYAGDSERRSHKT